MFYNLREIHLIVPLLILIKFENILGNIVHIKATFIKKWYNVIKSVNDLKDGK